MSKYLTIGIAGHVDHGKTSLVRSLTGIDTDRMKEEKIRGLSIESGIAPLPSTSENRIAFIDVPGHTDFLKNTIRGLSAVDMAILVVAADDGVMPQTIEHIQILNFFGVKTGCCVLSKADLVDKDTLELAELEIKEVSKGTFLDGKPIIPFSAVDKRGIESILKTIEEEAKVIEPRDQNAPFRLWIDQIRSFPGFGTVVTGTILSGSLRQGDHLLLLPPNIETKARSLEVHHQRVSVAYAGQRVGINIHKVTFEKVERGMALIHPETIQTLNFLNVELHVLGDIKRPIYNRQRVKLYLGTSVQNCLIILMKKERLEPGEKGLAQLRLQKPIPALPGDPFVICSLNMPTVIGGGRVLQVSKEKFRQSKAEMMLSYLKAIQARDVKEILDIFIKTKPSFPIKASFLAQDSEISISEFEKEIKRRIEKGELISFGRWGALSKKTYQDLKNRIPDVVEKGLKEDPLKKSIKPEEIKSKIASNLDNIPLQKMLRELCNEKRLVILDGGFRIPHISQSLSSKQKLLISLLLEFAKKSDVVPFSADTFGRHNKEFNKSEIQRFLDYLHAQGKLIRLNNRRYLRPEAMEKIKERVKEVISRKGYLSPQDSKKILGYGRTVGIPVFEYLDTIGFTCRKGNIRLLNKKGRSLL